MPLYALRPATADDAELIHALRAAGLREYVAQIWGWDDAEQWSRFRTRFEPARYQVVVVAGQDTGALSIEWRDDEAFLADIEIAPEWRGRGLGTAMVSDLMAEAERRGLPVALQVFKANPARRFYERLGFAVVGETPTHFVMRTDVAAAIGLRRGIVRLAPHHPGWRPYFAAEAARLRGALGERALAVEHVGSTAVEGLVAKPILDIMVGVHALNDCDVAIQALEALGYERRPIGDIRGRLFLVLGRDEVRQIHLSLAEPASDFWREHLLFRDVLRADPAIAAEYERIKQELAARFPTDRLSYTEGKDAFISSVLATSRGGG